MLTLLSPSKSQDFSSSSLTQHSNPLHLDNAAILIEKLRHFSPLEIQKLMDVSQKIAELNVLRYATWQQPFTPENSKQALLAFTGDVYSAIDAANYTTEDFAFAQQSLRILSGLYGILRPLDLIQPYRLEMKTKLQNPNGNDLYQFWKPIITSTLNNMLEETGTDTVINLASTEYFSAIDKKHLKATIITPIFKEYKNGNYKVIALFAKRARGAIADFSIRQRILDAQDLRSFSGLGYQFNSALSSTNEWVFTRGK